MNDLVFQNSNGNDVTTSLIVAEVFGKEHSKVMRDIENLSCSESFRVANFGYTPYTHPQNGQVYHYYEMTKDGFSFLVMGYTGTKAGEFKERFINEFNKREAMLKNDDYILMRSQQILQKRLEASEQKIKQLEAETEQQQATIELQEKEIKNATKNNRFLFGYLNIISTFAMYFNSQGKRKPAICVGIFYAITFCFIVKILIYRLLPPCGVLMHPLPCEVKYNGKGQPFFCL